MTCLKSKSANMCTNTNKNQKSETTFGRRRLIRRYLLARSAEQFSRVKIGALHSGKGYRGIKEEQEEEEEEEEKKRNKIKRYNM